MGMSWVYCSAMCISDLKEQQLTRSNGHFIYPGMANTHLHESACMIMMQVEPEGFTAYITLDSYKLLSPTRHVHTERPIIPKP